MLRVVGLFATYAVLAGAIFAVMIYGAVTNPNFDGLDWAVLVVGSLAMLATVAVTLVVGVLTLSRGVR